MDAFDGQYDCVAGVEARGFMIAAAVAYASGAGIIPVRKEGKLPRETISQSYFFLNDTGTPEIYTDDAPRGARVVVLDDVLATGGTLGAAASLLTRGDYNVAGFGVIMELTALRGHAQLGGHPVRALLRV